MNIQEELTAYCEQERYFSSKLNVYWIRILKNIIGTITVSSLIVEIWNSINIENVISLLEKIDPFHLHSWHIFSNEFSLGTQ